MEEKPVCCCGASVWTRAIGWIQLILSITSIAAIVTFLTAAREGSNSSFWHCLRVYPETTDEAARADLSYGFEIVSRNAAVWFVWVFFNVLQLAMAIVLLIGSYKKKSRFLMTWIIWTIVWLVVLAVLLTLPWFFYPLPSHMIAIEFVGFFVYVALKLFCILVVVTHKEDCESTSGNDPQVVIYSKF
ncbi:unnamed protein product [Allacma fusca]|uniref:Uncharacterized protein n=1 Tax=Allacma fusca TaxID=39272 RepID=A0A8J2K031_9HEXA|nr:unnamed protein product [Allacma fusca]